MLLERKGANAMRSGARVAGKRGAALARLVSLQTLLVAATVVVGLCQLGYAYFARSPAAGCITERAIARDVPAHASFGPGATRRQACSSDDVVATRRH
jgi:hypothetical protein